jgi:hypothetical protein
MLQQSDSPAANQRPIKEEREGDQKLFEKNTQNGGAANAR